MDGITVKTYIALAIGSLGFIANITQLIVICCGKTERKSVFGLSLISLNVADLLLSVSIILLQIRSLQKFNSFLVFDLWNFYLFSMISSLTHVTFIAVQRAIAVAFPFQVHRIISQSRCCIVLSVLWAISIALVLIRRFYSYTGAAFAVLCFAIVTGVFLIIMYSIIYIKTMKRNMVNNASEEMQRRRQQSDRHLLIYSMVLTVVFIICNYPYVIVIIAILRGGKFPNYVRNVCFILFTLNPFLDSLLYFFWSYLRRRKQALLHPIPPAANVPQRNQETAL